MLSPAEAKALGLVDEVVPKEKLQAAAQAAMQEMLRVPDFSRALSKWAAIHDTCCLEVVLVCGHQGAPPHGTIEPLLKATRNAAGAAAS